MFALIAVIIFALVAFGVDSSHVNLLALGLTSLALDVALGWSVPWPWARGPRR